VDLAVPVILQMRDIGAGNTFNNTKSVTFRITGTGDFDIPTTEDVTLTGQASSVQPVQAIETASKFKTVSSIECVGKTGTLLATELFSLGRAPVGIADYSGGDGITALDGQHSIRYLTANRALFLRNYDPLAKLYLWMDAVDQRMTYWEGPMAGNSPSRIGLNDYQSSGRGSISSRELAWATDTISTGIAIQNGHFAVLGDAAARNVVYGDSFLGWQTWIDAMARRFLNAVMPNKLFLSSLPKELKEAPYGNANGPGATQVFYGIAGREVGYFEHGLFLLTNVYGPTSPVTAQELANLELALRDSATGWRDFLWKTLDAGNITAPHVYLPTAMLNGGAALAGNVFGNYDSYAWTVFASQAQIPAVNPFTNLLINPANYPTVDDDWYVAAVTGTSAQMNGGSGAANGTACTLLKSATDVLPDGSGAWVSGPGGACPVRLKILGGGTYTDAKRRTFRVTGTDPKSGAVITDEIFAQGNGGTTQEFQTRKHFATVTSIQMVSNGAVANTGSTVVGETFRFGTTNVGLKANQESHVPGADAFPTYSDGLQVAYALAIMKYLGDRDGASSAVDTCIKRHCGTGGTPAASIAASLAEVLLWGEYTGGPAQRMEQWLKMLWCLTYNEPTLAPVADFIANVTNGAAPLTVSFQNRTYGKLNANTATTKPHQWDFGDVTDISNVRHPTHTYAAPGTYQVSYTATGPGGADTEVKAAYITVT
jgi:PKD repeat protein